jgi:hypothetical protein
MGWGEILILEIGLIYPNVFHHNLHLYIKKSEFLIVFSIWYEFI